MANQKSISMKEKNTLLVSSNNIDTTSVFNALSIGSGLVAVVLLCLKQEEH